MKRSIPTLLSLMFSLIANQASAQGLPQCDSFERTREGNILQGICYARSGHVQGAREQINSTCEQLILCGGRNDLGDCHLARNVCKGLVDPACNHGEFDVFNGPFVKNASCRAAQDRCAESPGDNGLSSSTMIRTRAMAGGVFPVSISWAAAGSSARPGATEATRAPITS